MKKVRLIAVSVLVLSAACGRRAGLPERPIHVAIHSEPISLDPHLANEVLTIGVMSNVYGGLTVLDRDLRVAPNLAASWENPDDRTWRFHLRRGWRFSDGRPVTAEDVVASIDRVMKHQRSQLASYLVEVEGVRAPRPDTVEVVTRRPFAALLNKLAFIAVVPKGAPDEITSPVGIGAYRVDEYVKGQRLALVPVTPRLQPEHAHPSVTFDVISDAKTRVDRLLDGSVDIVQDVKSDDVPRIEASGCCRVLAQPSAVVEFLHLAPLEPVLRDPRVRRAVHLAIDRRALVSAIASGRGQPVGQMVGPGIFGYDPELGVPERNLPEARRLLAEAGYPDGFAITLEHRDGRTSSELVRQLGEAGIRVTAVSRPWTEMFARLSRREVAFYYGGLAAVTADASDVFDSAVHSPVDGYGRTNFTGVSTPELDRLIEESGAVMRPEMRREILQRCMRLLMRDLHLVPLFVPHDLYAVRKDVEWTPRVDRRLLGLEMRRAPAP